MPLVLSVTSYHNQPPARRLTEKFDAASISIGRGQDNDWTLPDPEVHLSKKHCLITCHDGQYVITDISTNGVFINGSPRPLGNGGTAVLQSGDKLTLGDYEVLVELQAAAPQSAARIPVAAPMASPASDPFGLGLPASDAHPAGIPSAPEFSHPEFSHSPLAPSPPPQGPIGDDWLKDFDPVPRPIFEPSHQAPPTTLPDHTPAVDGFFRPPSIVPDPASAGQMMIPEDWHSTPAVSPPPLQAPVQPPPSPPPLAQTAPVMPVAPLAPELGAPAPRVSPGPRPAPSSGGDASGWSEFLSAAGLDPATLGNEDPIDLMRSLGRVFREMVAGMRDLLATRDKIKTEYRIQRTVLQATNNNPLKFAVDAEQAAALLLVRPKPGYLVGAKAVNEAYRDMKAHEIAFMVGMQAAVAALLKQFDPENLKQRIDKEKGWARQSRYWAAYEEHYRQISAEISEDARSVFGQAFAKAYEEQAKKL